MESNFETNLTKLLDKLSNCSSLQELEDKTIKLCAWVEKHNNDYTPSELEDIKDRISDSYITNTKRIEDMVTMVTSIEEDFFNQVALDAVEAKTVNQIKEEKKVEVTPITKETLVYNLQSFKDSLRTYDNLEDAKQTFHMYIKMVDAAIREYELQPMVGEILNEINLQIEANKAFLTTFNLQDKETYYNEEIMQENGYNALQAISYVVDDTEDYPF